MRAATPDLLGRRFGKLVVVERLPPRKGKTYWLCRCDCGGQSAAPTHSLRSGNTATCGCRRKPHGEAKKTKEFTAWAAMRSRVHDKNRRPWPRYGGRGIKICERWSDYRNFLADVGRAPSPEHTLDRIDNDGDYEPGNVRWATPKEQVRNRACTLWLEWDGQRRQLVEWAELLGIPKATLRTRLGRGWPVDRILGMQKRSA